MNPDRPSPEPDALSKPFFEGLATGELRIQRCRACGTAQLGERRCVGCGGLELEWRPASGRGSIHSFTVVHLAYNPAFRDELPYAAAVVELEEGPRVFASVTGIAAGKVRIGTPVVAGFERLASGVTVPVFSATRQQ